MKNTFAKFQKFFHTESSSGITLIIAATLALIAANTSWRENYISLFATSLSIHFGDFSLEKNFLQWINDGLMTIFFLVVGMEVKREILRGELASFSRASLPVIAAVGGVIVPAFIYLMLTKQNPELGSGWAIPCATDIAFSLGVLSLLGTRVPISLKVFLTAVAIIDDIAAVIIIGIFYGHDLNYFWITSAAMIFFGLIILNLLQIRYTFLYLFIGMILWFAILQSGIHATIAGVLIGFTIPLHVKNKNNVSLLESLETKLHPYVAFFILPLFAFANAGVMISDMKINEVMHPLTMAILLGLFFGKQLGIFGASWMAVRLGLARLPSTINWRQFYGIAIIAGIGFTMSLFISSLAFGENELQRYSKLGILLGSFISAIVGYIYLRYVLNEKTNA